MIKFPFNYIEFNVFLNFFYKNMNLFFDKLTKKKKIFVMIQYTRKQ